MPRDELSPAGDVCCFSNGLVASSGSWVLLCCPRRQHALTMEKPDLPGKEGWVDAISIEANGVS